MINLNDEQFQDKQLITEEALFEHISDYDVFNYYVEDLSLNYAFKSPLRADKNPSFSIFFSKKRNRLFYKDFGNGDSGSCIKMLMQLMNLSYHEALTQIVLDFGLESKFKVPNGFKRSKNKPAKVFDKNHVDNIIKTSNVIQITSRNWTQQDLNYWEQYGVSYLTLLKYNIVPIKYLFINGEVYGVDRFAYAYSEMKDSEIRYKIYQPFSRYNKWINNLIEGTLSGWSQLSESGDLLVISSSLKDGMCLHDQGFNDFIAPQTENYIFKPHIVDDLLTRFKEIVVFYDYDEAGLKAAQRMNQLYGFRYFTTNNEQYKDPSDYYKQFKDDLWTILQPIRQLM